MPVWQAVVYGVVQGLAEFLPISSSGHLALVPWLFGWEDPGLSFDVALHWGTLAAVLAVFWRDWIRLISAGVAKPGSPPPRRALLGPRHFAPARPPPREMLGQKGPGKPAAPRPIAGTP